MATVHMLKSSRKGRNFMARKSLSIEILGAVLILASAGAVQAQQSGSARQGLILARQICAECHAVSKGENQSANARAPAFTTIANVPGMTNAALSAALHTAHRTMPNIILKADETNDIIAYIQSLKSGD